MNPLLSLNTDKLVTEIAKDIKSLDANTKDKQIDFKNFLSNLLLKLDGKDVVDTKENKTEMEKKDISQPTKEIKSKDAKNGYVSLDELLNLVIFLKSNSLKGTFPTDSKKLTQILNNKQTLKEFRDIKSFKGLLKIAEKYDIKIKTFEFTKIEDHKKQIETKINKILTKIDTDAKNISKKEVVLSEKILQNIKNKKSSATHSIQKSQSKENTPLNMILKNSDITDKNIKKIKPNKSSMNIAQDINPHEHEAKNKTDLPGNKKSENIVKQEIFKEKNVAVAAIDENNLKDEKRKTKGKKTILEETKESSLFQKSKSFSKVVDEVKKDTHAKNIQKHTKDITKETQVTSEQKNSSHILKQHDDSSIKQENISHSSIHSLNNQKPNTKPPQVQQSLNTFANDLKEQMENFKPPLMRVKMTLSPKDLDEVNVSLISRGNNLQVTINSNVNTMALFTQNQAEFKNALVNMGFTNLNMNFSSNQSGQNRGQNHSKEQNDESFQNFSEQEAEAIDTINITVPRYV